MTTIVLAVIGVFGTVFASQGFWEWLRNRKKTPQDKMLLAIGRDRLLFLCKQYKRKEFIPEDEYEAFTSMGDAYIEMGGNSTIKKLYLECKNLPLKDE